MLYKYDTPTGPAFVEVPQGCLIAPEGLDVADAKPATHKEHQMFLTQMSKSDKIRSDPLARIADLEAQLNELKTQLQHEHPSHP